MCVCICMYVNILESFQTGIFQCVHPQNHFAVNQQSFLHGGGPCGSGGRLDVGGRCGSAGRVGILFTSGFLFTFTCTFFTDAFGFRCAFGFPTKGCVGSGYQSCSHGSKKRYCRQSFGAQWENKTTSWARSSTYHTWVSSPLLTSALSAGVWSSGAA